MFYYKKDGFPHIYIHQYYVILHKYFPSTLGPKKNVLLSGYIDGDIFIDDRVGINYPEYRFFAYDYKYHFSALRADSLEFDNIDLRYDSVSAGDFYALRTPASPKKSLFEANLDKQLDDFTHYYRIIILNGP